MVKNAQSRMSLVVGGAALLIIVVIIAVWLWPSSGPALTLEVSVPGKPVPGQPMGIVASMNSDSQRTVVLVAQLLTSTKQMVDIVRAQHDAPEGESEKGLSIKLPAGLPEGRYTAQVTARFDKTKVVTAETSVRVERPAQAVPMPEENATEQPVPGETVPGQQETPETPVVPQENEPMPSTPPSTEPSLSDEIPSIEPVVQDVPVVGAPMPMELEAIEGLASTDRDKALAECAKLPDANLCLSRVAGVLKDDNLCRSLQGFDADKCFLSVASAGNAGACANVQDPALRSTCEAVARFGMPVEETL